MPQEVSIGRYVRVFAVALVASMAATIGLIGWFDIDVTGFGLLQTAVAAMCAGLRFVQKNKRPPTKVERRMLIWMSFVVGWLLSLTALGLYVLTIYAVYGPEGVAEFKATIPIVPSFAWFIVIFFSSSVILAVLYFSYGYLTSRFAASMLTRDGLR